MTDWESIERCACGTDLNDKTIEEKINHIKIHIENARKKDR